MQFITNHNTCFKMTLVFNKKLHCPKETAQRAMLVRAYFMLCFT